MCSIIYLENADYQRGLEALILQRHRGPDSENCFQLGNDIVGATRLAIVDVSKGFQPMTTKDGRYTIAFNGEIYNYKSLQKKLSEKGIKFTTNCDTEVVLNHLALSGLNCPEKFEGQFAYVIRDNKTKKVYAARDKFGIKPLYFGCGDSGLVVASEIPVLLANKIKGTDIRILPQGCKLTYTPNERVELERYYDIRKYIKIIKPNITKYYELLNQAVSKRVPEEVEFATILSGIDSSTVAYFANMQAKKPQMTYTIATSQNSDDVKSAKLLSRQLGIENKIGLIDEDFIDEHLRFVIKHMATPLLFPVMNGLPTLKLAQMIKQDNIKVIMTGSGSDEINIGYDFLWELFDESFIEENAMNLLSTIGENECLREDRIFASQGLESRVPFLDERLVEYVISTPFKSRIPGLNRDNSKWHLKETMRGQLPDFIVNRQKDNLYRSTGVIPLFEKIANRKLSDKSAKDYIKSLEGTGWDKTILGGKVDVLFHQIWSELYPELARVSVDVISCGFKETPDFDDLELLSKYWVVAGGGIHMKGWKGGIK